MEHIDAVTKKELVIFGRVPQEAAPGARRGADLLIKLALGSDIDAARRIIEQDNVGVGGECASDEHFLTIAAAQRENGLCRA